MVEEIVQSPTIDQTESIELNLTAKGLYQWAIKVRAKELNDTSIARLVALTEKLVKEFPNNTLQTYGGGLYGQI